MLKKGFTLAEVLLTLTIIGVIAAITMPALMTNVNDNILEAQVRKFYSSLTDGLDMYKARTEQDTLIPGFNLDTFRDTIMHTENCDGGECFAAAYTNYERGALEGFDIPNDANVRRLRDGSVFAISQPNVNQNRWQVIADVNGRRGPNRMGEDLWRMFIDANGRIEINHIHPNDCKGSDAQGSCIGIFASNGMRFRNYRDYLVNGADVSEEDNGNGGDNKVDPPQIQPIGRDILPFTPSGSEKRKFDGTQKSRVKKSEI